mgnify:CR=1 FL=1
MVIFEGEFSARGHSFRCTGSYEIKHDHLHCGDAVATDERSGLRYAVADIHLPVDAGGDHEASLLQAIRRQLEQGAAPPPLAD